MSEQRRIQQYQEAVSEAERFVRLAGRAINRLREGGTFGSKETAAAKRASMDLSRALSSLRKGPWQ